MAYNASLANFMESQGVPYSGGIAALAPVSNEQVTSFLQANPMMTDAQIASAMNQYGVSPAQMAAATGLGASAVQSRYDTAQAANQNYQNLINQAYSSIGVKSPDTAGADYFRTQLESGAIKPEDFTRSFLTTASGVTDPTYAANVAKAKELLGGLNKSAVEKAYQTVLGRAGDTEGVNYFTGQLGLGALRPDQLTSSLAQAAIPVAKSLEDRIALQKFLGKDIYAPEAYLRGTSGMGYQDVVDYINANIQDPVKIAQAAARYGIDPSEILAAKKAIGGQDIPTIKAIEDYLAQGKAGLGTRIQDIIGSTIGDANVISTIEGVLPSSVSRLASITPELVSKKSIEEIEKLIAESPTNRLQEAGRVRGLVETIYGFSSDKAKQMASDLYAGKDTEDFAENLYKDLLKGGYNKELQNKILQDAAVRSPESKYFKENPDELLKYSPLKQQTGQTGVYGYLNDAPILNANFADKKLGDKNQVIPHLGSDPNSFGWTTNSKYTETIMRGPAIFGLEFNNRNDIEKAIATEQGIKNGTIIYDSEFGTYYNTRTGERAEVPKSDNERKGYDPYSSNTLAKLQEAAQKAGLNPSIYKSVGDLFDALEDKTKNIYQVAGRAIDWDPTAAKNLGITQTSGGRGGVNQANVLYEKIGDKLIPLQAKAFEFHDPNTSRGFFGDLFGGIASIPFVAEIASVATGGNPLVYAALKGAQTMALGGDLDDALKSAGLAYLTSSFIPKNITPNVQMALAQNSLVSSLAQSSPQLANFIIDGGTRAVISSGLAAITGQDPEKAALSALVQSGLGTMTKEGLNLTNIPEQYRGIVSNIISSTILGQDPKKSLVGAATGSIKKELSDFVKEQKEAVKSDQDKPRTPETRT
jgi:hypothetical protein